MVVGSLCFVLLTWFVYVLLCVYVCWGVGGRRFLPGCGCGEGLAASFPIST